MTGLSQSQFLQALGWSTLNSFWQMAFLWCCFWLANHLFNLSSSRKYVLSVAAVTVGFAWFIVTFLRYYQSSAARSLQLLEHSLEISATALPVYLTAASVAYLFLLVIPAYRLFSNWRFVQALRKNSVQKINIQYKLFVKKVGVHLGIKKEVGVYLSDLIKSPVTIGYLKPLILLPIASVNHLTIQQVEAVLLHELSHIKRHDYLVNLFLSITHTLLYFNPFVRFFIRTAESERENCCDQMVLQFGYDKISYADALLSLEKASRQHHAFAIGATGKKNLLGRIEKIVGAKPKPVLRFAHFTGFMIALFCMLVTNMILIRSEEKDNNGLAFNGLINPFYFLATEETMALGSEEGKAQKQPANASEVAKINKAVNFSKSHLVIKPGLPKKEPLPHVPVYPSEPEPVPGFINVALDEVENSLSNEEKGNVKAVVENTRKVLSSVQWKEIEKNIGDLLTESEKEMARQEYLMEIQRINWQNLEKNLKAEYKKIDWVTINIELQTALASVKLDSIQSSFELISEELEKAEKAQLDAKSSNELTLLFPDMSFEELKKHKNEIRSTLRKIKALRTKEVIRM